MNFGKRTSREESLRIMARALDAGIALFDTANAYNGGESERLVGEAVRGKHDQVLVATKVGFGRTSGAPEGLSAARIAAACDESLGRLGVGAIDLYYLHVPDPTTPIEESLGAMHELLRAGKVRRWGVSNYASWQILEIMQLADRAGMPRPVVSQQMYNLLIRQLDVEYFKFSRRYPIHTTVYNPLAGGLLAGKHERDRSTLAGSRFDHNALYARRYLSDAFFDATEQLAAVAADAGMRLLELAYAWEARRPGVDSVLVGPGSVAHLEDAIAAVQKPVPEEASRKVDAIHRALAGTDATYAR